MAKKVPGQGTATPTQKKKPIKVRATRVGYYDHARRRVGDVFVVDADAFSDNWMERADPSTPERITTAQEALRREHDEIIQSRTAPAVATGDANVLGD